MKSRYFVTMSYNGTGYHGWQIQPNGVTVQEVVTRAFRLILRDEEMEITGAGRTDSGVHARNFVAHFDTAKMPGDIPSLVFKLNSYLPRDIVIHRIEKVKPGAHARFDATRRTYHYFIATEKDPFRLDTAWYYYGNLDVDSMNRAAAILLQHSDFTSFSKLHTDVKTNICRVSEARWERDGYLLVFRITADRFLRNMVRAIVGTLVDVGKGKLTVEGFEEVIRKKDRGAAGESAPAGGLFLMEIGYDRNSIKI